MLNKDISGLKMPGLIRSSSLSQYISSYTSKYVVTCDQNLWQGKELASSGRVQR